MLGCPLRAGVVERPSALSSAACGLKPCACAKTCAWAYIWGAKRGDLHPNAEYCCIGVQKRAFCTPNL